MQSIRFDSFTKSNSVGPFHKENQDSYLVDSQNLLVAVADGVGGYAGAKEASSFAIEHLRNSVSTISDEKSLAKCLEEIQEGILRMSKRMRFANMGTTIAVSKIIVSTQSFLIANVGDSPVLVLRGESLFPVYEDDSFRAEHPLSMYGITQYLGLDHPLEIHTRELKYEKGNVLLLCSDGVTDNLLNSRGGTEKLASLVRAGKAEEIVETAIKEGLKPDDMTAVLVFL